MTMNNNQAIGYGMLALDALIKNGAIPAGRKARKRLFKYFEAEMSFCIDNMPDEVAVKARRRLRAGEL